MELTFIQKDQVLTTSLKVAEVFKKRHDNVIRDIRSIIEQTEGLLKNELSPMFTESTYINQQNKQQPMYLMNRDGFTLLVMGFNGKKALQWKLSYIQAFNAMESKLIEFLIERKSAEWLEARKNTKTNTRKLTDVIQQLLIPLAREQGATAPDKIFYITYHKLLNKTLGLKPNSRDELPAELLYELGKVIGMAEISIKDQASKKDDYHQIYRDVKQKLESYLPFINHQYFLN